MVEESNLGKSVNVALWLEDVKDKLLPPVCNAIMAGGFMKIMFVGGPNIRKDYHVEHGEEFFHQIKGDMCLKVMEHGIPRDIHIREGEAFVLPSRVPHSPQRNANTIGLVIERAREDQWDELRYYCEDNKSVLWRKYFHLQSLVKDFPLVINEYFASDSFKTGVQMEGCFEEDSSKLKNDTNVSLDPPISLSKWMSENEAEISAGKKTVFDKGELKICIYGAGTHQLVYNVETWLWVKIGCVGYQSLGNTWDLSENDSLLVPPNQPFELDFGLTTDSRCMIVTMDREATPQK